MVKLARDVAAEVARMTRSITDAKVNTMLREGSEVHLAKTGDRYTLHNIHGSPFGMMATIRRAVPKVKGKAARKAEKRARRAGRFL